MYVQIKLFDYVTKDRAEKHDLKSRLWLFFSPFLFQQKKGEVEKENE